MTKYQHVYFKRAKVGLTIIVTLIGIIFTHCSKNQPTRSDPASGEFSLLTYNVAGLPQGISRYNPEKNIPLISPLLNKFDIVLVQEDFYYHDELISKAQHPYKSVSNNGTALFDFGDGLNRFSVLPFTSLYREEWNTCSNNNGDDCLARKGFSVAETEIAPGAFIDIYNLHIDSGGSQKDFEARSSQIQQLLQTINVRSKNKAIIIAGDTNLNTILRSGDIQLFQILLEGANLTDACRSLSCGIELVDRVLFRSSASLILQATVWQTDPDFVDEQEEPLSDHEAVSVKINWENQ